MDTSEEGGEGGGGKANDGRIAVATYNVRDDRNGGLLSMARALDHTNVNVDVV